MIQLGDEILVVKTKYDQLIERVEVPCFRELRAMNVDEDYRILEQEIGIDIQEVPLCHVEELLEGVKLCHYRMK